MHLRLRHNVSGLFVFAFIMATLVCTRGAGATEVFINVEKRYGSLVKIAIPQLSFRSTKYRRKDPKRLGRLAKRVLLFDLQFSGYFDVIGNDPLLNSIVKKEKKSGKLNFQEWKDIGADALIRGEYYWTKNGEIVIEARLFDIKRGEQITGSRFTGTANLFRKMTHRFSDQVVYHFTGDKGVAESKIAFTTRIRGNKELVLADYDGKHITQLTDDKNLVLFPSWVPSGKEILFTTYKYKNPDLYSLNIKSGLRRPVSRKIGLNTAGSWSPDGKLIAFSMSTRGNSDIFTINRNGRGLKRLTKSRSIETSPSISPDGKRMAYVSDFSGQPQIYIMNLQGKNKTRFTYYGRYNADPEWSPRGDLIAYTGLSDKNFNIHVKRVDGRVKRQLTIFQGNNESPSWSPDGRHIAFTSTRRGRKQVYIMNANGKNQKRITNLKGEGYTPAWSPKSQ